MRRMVLVGRQGAGRLERIHRGGFVVRMGRARLDRLDPLGDTGPPASSGFDRRSPCGRLRSLAAMGTRAGAYRNRRRKMAAVPRAESLIGGFRANAQLIHHYADGVSEVQALRQLPFEANCMNWIVGHIVHRRNSSLACIGRTPIWSEDVDAMYRTGSDPVRDAGGARPLSDLMADLDRTQVALESALSVATDEDLDRIVENDRGVKSAAEHLVGFHWHEAYHAGQLDILRAFIDSSG
jgi:hypothetical protein